MPPPNVDGDGYCAGPICAGSALPGDCDDDDASINPGAEDACNGIDDNCDGFADDEPDVPGCTVFFVDNDGDTFGGALSVCECAPAFPFTARNDSDCYDDNADARPGQLDTFASHRGDGSFDYDCDGFERREDLDVFDCGCPQSTLDPVDFAAGWEFAPPLCGETRPYVTQCSYSLSLNVPNPLWPLIGPQTITECLSSAPANQDLRTQECR